LNYVFYSNYKRLSRQIEFRRREISQCGMRPANFALTLSIMGLRPLKNSQRWSFDPPPRSLSQPADSRKHKLPLTIAALDSFPVAREQSPAGLPMSPTYQVLVGVGTSSMATAIRDVTGSELRLFGDIVARLERLGPESDARAVIFMDVMRLLLSDFGASYVWNARKNRFDEAVSFN